MGERNNAGVDELMDDNGRMLFTDPRPVPEVRGLLQQMRPEVALKPLAGEFVVGTASLPRVDGHNVPANEGMDWAERVGY